MIERGVTYETMIGITIFTLGVFLLFNAIKLIRYLYKRQKGQQNAHLADGLAGKSRLVYLFARSSFYFIDVCLVIFLLYCSYDLSGDPHPAAQYPVNNEVLTDGTVPIYVLFNRPLDPQTIKPYIHPEVEGEWKIESVVEGFSFVKRKLTFYPKWSLPVNEKVFIYIAGIANPLSGKEPWEFGLDSFTPSPIEKVSVEPATGIKDQMTDNMLLTFTFDQPAGLYYDWDLIFEPVVAYEWEVSSQSLKVAIKDKLAQSTKYSYTLKGVPSRFDLATKEVVEVTGELQEFLKGDFETVKEPLLDSIEPQGDKVLPDATVMVSFDQDMEPIEPDSYFKIAPEVQGDSIWKDQRTLEYTHEPFAKETSYTLTIKSGLESALGGIIEQDLEASFTTIGKVRLDSSNPANNANGVSVGTNISLSFDQEVVAKSVEDRFTITPGISGNFSWNGVTLTFNPNANLNYSTKYSVKVASGVESVYGLNSDQEFSFSFTTQSDQFKLNVPIYYQKLRFSCNLEASRMALAYRGVYKEVLALHAEIKKDTTAYDEVNNIFGDPYSGYVGDIYGVTKGYGVYWPPISELIGKYRSNAIRTGWNLEGLLNEVRSGNPVVIWAHNGYSYAGNEYYWTTPGGKSIRAVTGMHSYVVVGFKGPIEDPSHVILNDSNRGVWTISKSYFLSLWGYFNNSGVIVY
jgi:uncharacterized protein YvpB